MEESREGGEVLQSVYSYSYRKKYKSLLTEEEPFKRVKCRYSSSRMSQMGQSGQQEQGYTKKDIMGCSSSKNSTFSSKLFVDKNCLLFFSTLLGTGVFCLSGKGEFGEMRVDSPTYPV